ncbi:Ribosomal protein S18 [Ascosphaera apis ARSEF 7405]|uniref:Small ribosomal subunit protein bS18m n=1 Tax=Ascosphaera apis ARSEF 7405 TaxID=392613 RepID=A0A162IQD3_9EURO|nr:Ribosomal protein S18 [Ascosphaera apis ARSEF 7405]
MPLQPSRGVLSSLSPAKPCLAQWQPRRWSSTETALGATTTTYSSVKEARLRGQERTGKQYAKMIADSTDRTTLYKNQTRVWRSGDVYSPRDMLPGEMRKWRNRQSPSVDVFDYLALNPLDLYKNYSVMSEYVSDMGRIKHSSETGLRPVNQRKISKAIRRAIGLGLMPSVYKHPELLIDMMRSKAKR